MTTEIQERVARLAWKAIETSLWERGYAKPGPLLMTKECEALIALYHEEDHFRSRIDMRRFRFGEGEYMYFKYPLPSLVQKLRQHVYPRLAPIANAWMEALGETQSYPMSHAEFLTICDQHGQTKPTPLLLSYTLGGYNC